MEKCVLVLWLSSRLVEPVFIWIQKYVVHDQLDQMPLNE